MNLRNLTPHALVVLDADDTALLTLPPCSTPPRIEQHIVTELAGPGGVVVQDIRYGGVVGLPGATPGTLLVVSRVVAREVSRHDLVFPDGEVRDADGRVVGCRRLARFCR